MSKSIQPSRRDALKTIAAAGAAFWASKYTLAQNAPTTAPNSRINVAFIGAGGRASALITEISKLDTARVAALCDVDTRRAKANFEKYKDIPQYQDYREMLDKEGDRIDAVAVGTPDHVHYAHCMAAIKINKHVYCEKPLCQTIVQTRELRDAAVKAGIKTQMGNQGSSLNGPRDVKEWVDAGLFGQIRNFECWTNRPIWPQGIATLPAAEPIPKELNWDLWRHGVDVPYNNAYLPFNWRGFTAFGCGAIGDMACHLLGAFMFAFDPGPPDWILCDHQENGSAISFPTKSRVIFHFPARKGRDDFILTWRDGKDNLPEQPGDFKLDAGGGLLVYGKDLTINLDTYASKVTILPKGRKEELQDKFPKQTLDRIAGQNHQRNWIDSIRGTVQQSSSHFEYAARLNELALLGVIAQRLPGLKLLWDEKAGKFTNSDAANKLMG